MTEFTIQPWAQEWVDIQRHHGRSLGPSAIYAQAKANGYDYIELMKAAGHIVPKREGGPRG